MKTKIKDFSNTSLSARIRHWLIKKLAGKHLVVLNARIDIVARKDHPGFSGRVVGVRGGMVESCVFPDYGPTIIQLSGVEP